MAVVPGTPDDDEMIGTLQGDNLFGYDGDDILDSGPGEDVLVGHEGDDELIGGDDADEFAFGPDDDDDIIQDFNPGNPNNPEDVIVLLDGTPDDIELILSTVEDDPITGDALVTYGDTEITLTGFLPEDVSGYWFMLA